MVILMSDWHEMFEGWRDLVQDYDPDYPIGNGKVDDEHVRPVDPDAWADDNIDIEGGF